MIWPFLKLGKFGILEKSLKHLKFPKDRFKTNLFFGQMKHWKFTFIFGKKLKIPTSPPHLEKSTFWIVDYCCFVIWLTMSMWWYLSDYVYVANYGVVLLCCHKADFYYMVIYGRLLQCGHKVTDYFYVVIYGWQRLCGHIWLTITMDSYYAVVYVWLILCDHIWLTIIMCRLVFSPQTHKFCL